MHENFRERSIVGIFLVLLVFAACAKNPVTGKKELALISESQEIALGKQTHPEILAEFGELENPSLQRYFSELGQEMARISHRPDLPWHFTVLDDPLVNAFAVPGGYIYFTRGILAYMNNEAELAGVLGHEIGHVTARHSVSQVSKAQLFGLGLGLGSIFSPTFRQFDDLAQMGVGLLFLKYSRDDETQSDELGVRYMYESGYDPHELSDFFTVFQRMSEESGEQIPNWLSTHPSPPNRVEHTEQLAGQLVSGERGIDLAVRPERFLREIDGLMFGPNPREGFSEDGIFYHPDLAFQLNYPNGWRVNNSRSSVVFADPSQRAAVQLTIVGEPVSPVERARALANQPGVSLVSGQDRRVGGNSAYVAFFSATAPNGNRIQAVAAFIDYRQNLYQLIGMSDPREFERYSSVFEDTLFSFRELRDRKILSVQPDRLQIHRSGRGQTLRDISRLYPNERVGLSELAVLNRKRETEPLPAGTPVKVVVASR